MKLLIVALAMLLTYPASAIEQTGNTITLTDAEAAQCRAGGGCVVVPQATLQQAMRKVLEGAAEDMAAEAVRQAKELCRRRDA